MRTFEFDFAPMWRSTIGFDRFFDLINQTQHLETDHYPPYDVLRTGEDNYRINLAVAGFSPDEINITAQQGKLTITGRKMEQTPKDGVEVLYHGISARPFERNFNLDDHVEVQGATFENGLLQVDLVRRVPEAMKPRKIPIGQAGSNDNKQLAQKQAA